MRLRPVGGIVSQLDLRLILLLHWTMYASVLPPHVTLTSIPVLSLHKLVPGDAECTQENFERR